MFGLMVLSQPLKFFDTVPRTPMIIGMTLILLLFHILISSHFKSLYLSIFSFPFSCTLISNGQATSIIIQVLFCLSRTTMSGLLYLSSLSVCILKSHNILLDHFLPQTLVYAHNTSLHGVDRLLYTILNVLLWQYHHVSILCNVIEEVVYSLAQYALQSPRVPHSLQRGLASVLSM